MWILFQVPDAEEALAFSENKTFSVLISDHWLPGIDGPTLPLQVGEKNSGGLAGLDHDKPPPT
jgi:DNA-binding NtrC family response regulator